MRHRTLIRALCLMIAVIGFPLAAAAQDGAGVVIMKFEQFDANPDVLSAVGETLEGAIEAHPDMYVKPGGEMTIKDLALTAGCGQPDEECLQKLRDFVDADRVVFGSVQASGDVHLFSMKMFDFAEGRFIAQITDESVEGDIAHVQEVLPAVVEGLLYGPVGTLTVDVSGVDSPDLIFDGEKVGLAPTTLENLPLGEHIVTVRTSDGDEQSEKVVLRHDQPVTLEFAFEPSATSKVSDKKRSEGGPSVVPGIVSIGLGVVGLGVGAFSSLQVSEANSDNQRLGDDGYVDPETGGFYSPQHAADAKADGLDAESIKSRGKTFQTVQWVGYGVGAVGVGVGIYLLARAMGGNETEASAALPFDVGFAPTADGFATTLRARF